MKTLSLYFVLIFALAFSTMARTKVVEKHFPAKPNQRIEFAGLGGAHLTIKSWDKDEVYVKVKFSFSSSKDEYEENVIKSFDIISSENDSTLSVSSKKIGNESTWSYFLGIKFRMFFYESSNLEGEIFVPRNNSFKSGFQYSSISLQEMKGAVELLGTGNTIEVKNCNLLNKIKNNYGKIKITDCGGNLVLKSINSDIDINGLSGSLDIDGDYSNIILKGIAQNTSINSKSGKQSISDIGGDLLINSPYSTIQIDKVNGFVDVRNQGGPIDIKNVGGVKVDAAYATISIKSVTGKSGKEIFIKGQSGKLLLENIVGNLNIESPYSPMELRNIKGDVKISGSSAEINGEKITGNLKIQSPYSKLFFREVSSKNIFIKDQSSQVDIKLITVPEEIDIENDYGNVNVEMPDGYSGEVNLSVEHGLISSNLSIEIKKTSSSQMVSAMVGRGNGKINIETKAANITLTQKSN
ncbi:MAG: DUF4097 family beta strand repeat-containing protein [Ignavibacteria bacterium]|nr:DUF4097 family beta strand repeat-containing protein [Ignavibacteria bacterium]